jgi:serine/threonine-protein kinase
MPNTAQLDALFQRWHRLRQQGQPTPPEQLCADCPELLPLLKEQIDALPSTATPVEADSNDQSRQTTRRDGKPPKTPGDSQLDTPRQFAGYEILGLLGRGGMGVVYKARHPTLGIEVALKTMRFDEDDPGLAERFLREAQAVVRLNHPHIVRLYEAGQYQRTHYYTMDYVAGGNLYQRRQEFTGDARRAAALMEKVARGVQHAHERGIIHRDLKPGNILLDEHGEPRVSDFGLAKFLEDISGQTTSGLVLGTAAYMPPEQAAGHNSQVGTHSDVWALGVVLYELLTNQKPFPGPVLVQALYDIQQSDPPRPSSLNRRLDRSLETIVLKCLEKDPARRYASAGALADDLGRWLRGEPILARSRPWPVRIWRREKRRLALTACGLLLLLTAVAAPGLMWQNDPDRALRHIESRLQQGEKVELLDPSGAPRWYRWRTGEDEARLEAKDGSCRLSSLTWAVVELLPRPKVVPFRLEAVVRHDDGMEASTVGLYFCYSEMPEASGKHYFATVNFTERGWSTGQARFDLFGWWDPGLNKPFRGRAPIGPPMSFQPDGNGKTWRHLAVEVRARTVCVFFDGFRHGEYPYKKLNGEQRYVVPPNNDDRAAWPTFRAEQGVGLFVFRSTAYFRSVTISRLEE